MFRIFVDVGIAGVERDRCRHGGADPQIAFFEFRKELETQRTNGHAREEQQHDQSAQRQDPISQREADCRLINLVHQAHRQRVLFAFLVVQEQPAQSGGHGESGQQTTSDGVGISLCHWTDRQKVGQFTQQEQQSDRKGQGKRDRPGGDKGGPNVAEKDVLQDERVCPETIHSNC